MDIQELYEQFDQQNFDYFNMQTVAEHLQITNLDDQHNLAEQLNQLCDQGFLNCNKKNKYVRTKTLGFMRAKLRGNAKGFAFAILDDKQKTDDDYFIPHHALHGALHNDSVLIRKAIGKDESKTEAEVVKILNRGTQTLVGTFILKKDAGFVQPDDKRFFVDVSISAAHRMSAITGDKVWIKITDFPIADGACPSGQVMEIIGHDGDPWLDVLSVMRQHNIKEAFDEDIMRQAQALPQTVFADECKGREDFRKQLVITIDGEDARDLDDAISLQLNADGTYSLNVYIADVSHYVKEHTALNKEAYDRGTSVYFPDRVIPMLPPALSNGICSLNEHVDRLVLAAVMHIDTDGKVIDRKLCEGVICTANRMTYTDVTKILNGDHETCKRYPHLVEMVKHMSQLTACLQKKRSLRGSINFDMPECKIEVDKNGKAIDIQKFERSISHCMIEEFMILANETVAEFIQDLDLPFLYRVHEKPSLEKVTAFYSFIAALGLSIHKTNELHATQLLELLQSLEGNPVYSVVNRVMLRTMQKAKYFPQNIGHFGLASQCYCHFTSPIRRYPDLIVHRIVKQMLKGAFDKTLIKHYEGVLYDIAAHCSETEKQAEESEREVDELKKAEFMSDKIGKTYAAVISGVTSFGVFCELPNTVEGLIRIENLEKDNYEFLENHYMLKGSKHSYRLGDAIEVDILSVELATRRVEMILNGLLGGASHENNSAQQKSKPRLFSDGHLRSGYRADRKRNQIAKSGKRKSSR